MAQDASTFFAAALADQGVEGILDQRRTDQLIVHRHDGVLGWSFRSLAGVIKQSLCSLNLDTEIRKGFDVDALIQEGQAHVKIRQSSHYLTCHGALQCSGVGKGCPVHQRKMGAAGVPGRCRRKTFGLVERNKSKPLDGTIAT
jgi:hypothetical protein